MSKIIKLKRGLDILLEGGAEPKVSDAPSSREYAVCPDDFEGVTPKLLVKAGDQVKAGSPLFFDKNRPEIVFSSPVSGTVSAVNRGDKRKILNITVEADAKQLYETFDIPAPGKAPREEIVKLLLTAGLWPMIIRRPYGVIADPDETPKAIFLSGFDSAPLAPDMDFVLKDELKNLQAGIDTLATLTPGKVHLSLKAGREAFLGQLTGVEKHVFEGPHPAGNIGVQIHHIDPVNKGESVWTVDIQNVAIIGRLMLTGQVDMTKTVAVTGSEIIAPQYYKTVGCAPVVSLVTGGNIHTQKDGGTVRIISGNVLTGKKVAADGSLGYYANQITVIPEGDKYELLGWAMPRFNKLSVGRDYFSWLMPGRKYRLDTNLNGGVRAFVFTGLYERYLPMDIYPMYLLKAIMAGDIDKMENLGIYEVVEEDFALCEFVDPSKTDMQQIVRDGINLMIKELN